MAKRQYFVQLKLSSWNLEGGYSEGEAVVADTDAQAIKKGREYLQERKSLGQSETGFRVLRLVHEESVP